LGEDGEVPYRICFVCSGNICRSPTAEIVTRRLLAEAGLDGRVRVDSAGLGDWHVGEDADPRSVAALRRRGYEVGRHRARQFTSADFATRDLVVALDSGHQRALRALAPTGRDAAKVRLLRSYDPALAATPQAADLDIADPYWDDEEGFNQVLETVEAACRGLLLAVRRTVVG
jgi:low molecular weight protein-tyrosine phosphatase